jgi:choline-sulfatase
MPSQPNILILMADQLNPTTLPAYGNKVALTPHMDRLCDEAVVFESAYCNSPLCAPSRYSFLSGQLPSAIGAYDNAAEFAASVPTFAHYLRSAGYRTVLSGKMHFCGADQLHGFEERLTTDIYPSDFGWTPDWRRFQERPSWYHSMQSVTQAGPCVRSNQVDFDEEVVSAARRKLYDMARGSDRRPFCMVASLTHPHDPFTIPEPYWNRYATREIPAPRVSIPVAKLDPHSRRLRHVIGLEHERVTDEQVRAARRAYYGAVSFVDDQFGVLISALEEAKFAPSTVTILLADHGEMLGERGLWYKMNFFEGGSRIPLVVHAPGRFRPGRVRNSVSLVDLLPTLVAIGGGESHDWAAPLAGHSLVPHLTGGAGEDRVEGEYLGEGAVAPIVMIREGRFKFVHCPVDPDQLYDLEADPDELVNLAQLPQQSSRVAELREQVARRWDLARIHEQVLASQERRLLVGAALKRGRLTAWDYTPPRDGSQEYIRNHMDLEALEALARFPRIS